MSIDVHSHAIPLEALEGFKSEPFKYGLELREDSAGQKSLVTPSGFAFPVYEGFYDAQTRLKDLDARHVEKEILTPAPNSFFYDIPAEIEIPFIRKINDGIAAMCRQAPERLIPGGALPMQDIAASCDEAERLHKAYGVRLLLVNTNIGGKYYDDPSFFPLFEICEKLGVVLFFHPAHNNTSYGLAPYYLTNLVGNPVDTTVSAARLVLGGALRKYPRCKCLFAHGGGFLPYQRGRLEHGFRVREEPKVNLGEENEPAKYFDELLFDTITHRDEALAFLISTHGAERVMLGSDYPFDMADVRPSDVVLNVHNLSDEDKDKVLRINAENLFIK